MRTLVDSSPASVSASASSSAVAAAPAAELPLAAEPITELKPEPALESEPEPALKPEPELEAESVLEAESEPEAELEPEPEPEVSVAPIMDSPPWEEAPYQPLEATPHSEPEPVQPLEPQATPHTEPETTPYSEPAPVQPLAPATPPAAIVAAPVSAPAPQKARKDWTLADLSEDSWIQVFNDLNLSGMTHGIAANMVFAQRQGTKLQFTLQQGQSSMLNETHQSRIRQALEEMFACDLQLTIDIGETQVETPFASRQRREKEQQDLALASLQSDANVASLSTAFNGQLDTTSVLPIHPIET